jgi:Arc/MetJ-type ribon-helix-helix transcriptional regulator
MTASKTARRSVAMTPQMRLHLQQLLEKETRDVTEADLIRQAIREYLDRQEDVTGSKAHFRKTFRDRIDQLQDDLEFHLHVITALIAYGLAVMLPTFTEQSITTEELIQAAIVAAERNAETVQEQINAVRDS